MTKRIRLVVIIGVLLFVVVLGVVGYFSYTNIAYVDTLHARIDGEIVQVRAPAAGRVVELALDTGDAVAEHEEVVALETTSGGGGQPAVRLWLPIRAPMDGVVADITSQPGDVVAAGQLLLTLMDPGRLWITANIHESRISQVRVGQTVRIDVNTRTVRTVFWGRVEQIGRATTVALSGAARSDVSTPRAAEVPIRIAFDPAGYTLYPGMTAQVRIQLSPRTW